MSDNDHPDAKPWERPVEPDHPMMVEGGIVDGDTAFMARCLFEELLRGGLSLHDLRAMTCNPQYQALYAIRTALGPERVELELARTAARVGIHRFVTKESIEQFAPATLTIGATDGNGGGPCGSPRRAPQGT